MKKIMTLLAISALAAACSDKAPKVAPAIPSDAEIEKKVSETLSKMTLEEKIGQMTEIAIDILGKMDPATGKFVVDDAALDKIIGQYKVGSILNAPGMALSAENWNEVISAINRKSMETMGIPCIYGLDQNHGVTYTAGGTMFPQNINVAASFNRAIAHDAAEATAYETRATDCPWTYSPTLDLDRDPRWSRFWENYGEDPYLSGQMAVAAVKGFQGEDPNHIDKYHIAVSLKHYLGYGAPRTGLDRTPAIIAPNDLREKYFAPYKAAIEAGALNIMVNSSSINGVPVHASRELLTEWLKEGLNWDGMIVTDWSDINNLYQREKVAKDKKEAIKIAINAGIDMSMEPYDLGFCDLLKELVNEGEVPMERIDDATARVLRMKYRLGLFDTPDTKLADYPEFGGERFAELALKSAEETMVLLKNDGILPLAPGKKILLAGPNANSMRSLNGGWSYSWQGHLAPLFTEKYNTIYEAFQAVYGEKNVILEQGVTYKEDGSWWEENEPEIQKAVAAARGVDVIFACIGENSYCETPGNLPADLTLSENQRNLVKALAATGKPIVLILNEGRPRIISDIEPLASAVVDIMLPANSGGDALANLVSGKSNFSGRLPFTYPRDNAHLTTYDYKVAEQVETMEGAYDYNALVSVQWAFGYGLSYTTFEYSGLKVDKASFKADDILTFEVTVKNTGTVEGKEAVLLFSSDLVASVTPDNRRLRAFDKVLLAPGESKVVTLKVPARALAFVGPDALWHLEKGDFRIQVGSELLTITCEEDLVF